MNYCLTMRGSLQDAKLKEKFKAGQKERIEAFLQQTLDLLNSPSSIFGSKDDFSRMQKELD